MTRTWRPRSRVGWCRLSLAFLGWVLLLLLATLPASAQSPNRAGLVVQYGDGRVESACVEFEEPEISGFELLQRAGLPMTYDPHGGTKICSIRGEGCDFPADACFCHCATVGSCRYWSYHRLATDGTWRYSELGAGASRVQPGDVDGWRWGAGSANDAPPPPGMTFEEICPARPGETTPAVTPSATGSTEMAAAVTATVVPTGTRPVTPTEATATPVPGAEQEDDLLVNYLLFGLMAVGLLAAILWARRAS